VALQPVDKALLKQMPLWWLDLFEANISCEQQDALRP
jgi:hypothetical protein